MTLPLKNAIHDFVWSLTNRAYIGTNSYARLANVIHESLAEDAYGGNVAQNEYDIKVEFYNDMQGRYRNAARNYPALNVGKRVDDIFTKFTELKHNL